jgi:hypothetical protein
MKIKEAFLKNLSSFKNMAPVITGVLLLVSLSTKVIPKSFYAEVFTGNEVIDPLLGALFGSISAGNPITSYVIGGEFLKQGVSLLAVTAFISTWVSVGLVQLPAESFFLGKKFALTRNIVSFAGALGVSLLTFLTLNFLK